MTRFTLAVLPDGRALLTTTERLDDAQRVEVREAVDGWSDGRWPVLVLADCETIQIASVELDLEPAIAEAPVQS